MLNIFILILVYILYYIYYYYIQLLFKLFYLGSFVGAYPARFNATFIAPPQADKYDMIFNHFRWNEEEVRRVSYDDTVYITSIR